MNGKTTFTFAPRPWVTPIETLLVIQSLWHATDAREAQR